MALVSQFDITQRISFIMQNSNFSLGLSPRY